MTTQLDRMEAAIAAMAQMVRRLDLEQRQQVSLLSFLSNGVQIMSLTADQSKAATDALVAKADLALAALVTIQTSNTALTGQLATLQAQVTALQAQIASGEMSPADAAEIQAGIAEAQAESAKIDAALAPVVASAAKTA